MIKLFDKHRYEDSNENKEEQTRLEKIVIAFIMSALKSFLSSLSIL